MTTTDDDEESFKKGSSKEPGKGSKWGSFALAPSDEGEPYWNYLRRDPAVPIREEERKVLEAAIDLCAQAQDAIIPEDVKLRYIDLSRRLFWKGCVKQGPEPKAALKELNELRKTLLNVEIGDRIANLRWVHICWAFWLSVASTSVGLIFLWLNWYLGQPPTSFANYCFVWSAAMVAVMLSDSMIVRISDFVKYIELEQKLKRPEVRVPAAGGIAIVASVLWKSGFVLVRIPFVDPDIIENSVNFALTFGFFVGIASSRVMYLLIDRINRSIRS